MKMQLRIVLLLALGAQVVYPAAIVAKRALGKTDVAEINNVRAELAAAAKISNMHELSWDTDLEKKIQTADCKSEPKGPFMVVVEPSQEMVAQLAKLPQEQQGQIGKEMMKNALKAFFGPKQTRIGCAKPKCSDAAEACLIGPQTSVSEGDFTKGEPGSNCPNGKTSSGLCKYSTSTLSFASVLLIVVSFLYI